MATTTYFGWETPDDTDLVKDGAAAIRTLGSAIDTSMSQLEGGTTGQILSKTSATDMAFTWINNDQGDITAVTAGTGISGGGTSGAVTVTNSMATAITTDGDLIKGTGSGTFDRLGIGTTGQVLTVAAGAPSWATAASGMSLIVRTSFSNVASQAFDSVFTSTYSAYLIVAESLYGTTDTNTPYFQFRYAGPTTQSASYYGGFYGRNWGGSIQNLDQANQGFFAPARAIGSSGEQTSFALTVRGVGNASERPSIYGNSMTVTFGEYAMCGSFNNTARTYTGFLISASAGNVWGTVAVYGLAK